MWGKQQQLLVVLSLSGPGTDLILTNTATETARTAIKANRLKSSNGVQRSLFLTPHAKSWACWEAAPVMGPFLHGNPENFLTGAALGLSY